MGKAARWFKGLLGMKKEKNHVENSGPIAGNKKEKKRWSFGKSVKDSSAVVQSPVSIPANMPATDAAWLRSYIAESEKEQNKHAIAVAAATAAAADAAVAAAQAAVAVVRLTSHGRGTMFGGGRERWASVKIQSVFRGYLVSGFSILFIFLYLCSFILILEVNWLKINIQTYSVVYSIIWVFFTL